MSTSSDAAAAPTIPRSLFVFSIFYGGMVCIAGVLANKQVSLGPLSGIGELLGVGPLAVEAGIFAFLMLVTTSSAVAELFGRPLANRLVLVGFVPLIASILLMLIIHRLPHAMSDRPDDLAHIQAIMGQSPRVMAAGIVAYGTSQFLNVTIFSALKRPGGRLLWLRAATAAILSQIVDTLLFITIAFYGLFPIASLMIGQMLAKIILSALLVTPLVYVFVALGRRLDARA